MTTIVQSTGRRRNFIILPDIDTIYRCHVDGLQQRAVLLILLLSDGPSFSRHDVPSAQEGAATECIQQLLPGNSANRLRGRQKSAEVPLLLMLQRLYARNLYAGTLQDTYIPARIAIASPRRLWPPRLSLSQSVDASFMCCAIIRAETARPGRDENELRKRKT